jgi:hypothetical protein
MFDHWHGWGPYEFCEYLSEQFFSDAEFESRMTT